MNSRYDGKPFLRLLELYVLWAIGELPDAEEAKLRQMNPKLQLIYAVNGTWQQVIVSAMRIPPDLPAALREMWSRNLQLARVSTASR
jgi:hypothetical protein